MKEYDPSQYLISSSISTSTDYAFILLNQPISQEQKPIFETLWRNATLRLCADGAANRLLNASNYEFMPYSSPSISKTTHLVEETRLPLPHAIRGDLDSVTEETLEFFKSKGVPIQKIPSQYSTDLQKCVQAVEDFESLSCPEDQLSLIVFGGLSGRLDQTAHTLHVLWQLAPEVIVGESVEEPPQEGQESRGGKLLKRERTFVVGDGCVTWLLPKGTHLLKHNRAILGKTCGVLPFGIGGYPTSAGETLTGPKVRTKGLEWDLDGQTPSAIGGLLSTSNHLIGDGTVEVETDLPVYWSVEFKTE